MALTAKDAYGVWWREGEQALVSLVLGSPSTRFVMNDQNEKLTEKLLSPHREQIVYTFHLPIRETTNYLTVQSQGGREVLLVRQFGSPSYEILQKLGVELGDWMDSIKDAYISFASTTIKQIDGLLYNL